MPLTCQPGPTVLTPATCTISLRLWPWPHFRARESTSLRASARTPVLQLIHSRATLELESTSQPLLQPESCAVSLEEKLSPQQGPPHITWELSTALQLLGARFARLLWFWVSIWDHLPRKPGAGCGLTWTISLLTSSNKPTLFFTQTPRHKISSLCWSSWENSGGPKGSMTIMKCSFLYDKQNRQLRANMGWLHVPHPTNN